MSSVANSPFTDEQVAVWLRGLLAIAWADGKFDEQEQHLIAAITHQEVAQQTVAIDAAASPEEVAAIFGQDKNLAHNFLRTAVMVALADGVYSPSEDILLHEFCDALGVRVEALDSLKATLEQPQADATDGAAQVQPLHPDVLKPVRNWLDGLEVQDPKVARFLCKMIPSQCPFERDVVLFGHKLVSIPPLCELNPLYEQLVGLRFRALSYLADDCQEDVSDYV